ncbi:MAG: prolipoprotein diacylglyceryl transferase [Capsulimonadales bacterium]|nr:prolipoprotein diacylglyceryl transferase [Capsulimonadales bacterium]
MGFFPIVALPALTPSAGCYLAAYLVGCLAFVLMAKRRRLLTEGIGRTSLVALVGGLVGANVTQYLASGSAGKTVLGGLAGGYLSVVLYKRMIGLRRPTGDLFAVALMAGEGVGRWGCFLGGCCFGRTCDLPFAVYQHDAWRHPAQLYLSLACFTILGILLFVEFRRPLPENGLFYLQGLLYCPARFLAEYFREGHLFALGLTLAQWCCLAGFVFFLVRWRQMQSETEGKHAVRPG